LLRQQGCTLVLGTDSLASNHSLSILDEMKILSASFPAIAAEEMLRWATSQGASALQLDNQLGRLTPGKSPGILQIDNLSSAGRIHADTHVTRWW
jgi:cytosine/adenosine deaminase-related metal-dependent hydrolase